MKRESVADLFLGGPGLIGRAGTSLSALVVTGRALLGVLGTAPSRDMIKFIESSIA
jgi:hypothetical protein